jgi:hypothetical protein
MNLPKRPATCAIHPCQGEAAVPLRQQPPHTTEAGVFWFCAGCAPAYERMGYERVEGQEALSV